MREEGPAFPDGPLVERLTSRRGISGRAELGRQKVGVGGGGYEGMGGGTGPAQGGRGAGERRAAERLGESGEIRGSNAVGFFVTFVGEEICTTGSDSLSSCSLGRMSQKNKEQNQKAGCGTLGDVEILKSAQCVQRAD